MIPMQVLQWQQPTSGLKAQPTKTTDLINHQLPICWPRSRRLTDICYNSQYQIGIGSNKYIQASQRPKANHCTSTVQLKQATTISVVKSISFSDLSNQNHEMSNETTNRVPKLKNPNIRNLTKHMHSLKTKNPPFHQLFDETTFFSKPMYQITPYHQTIRQQSIKQTRTPKSSNKNIKTARKLAQTT